MTVNRGLIGQVDSFDRSDRVALDMDSSESPVHGQQEGSAYNGHFEAGCYHPLFLFNDHGDCLAAKLRSGNVSSADDWDELFLPEIDRQQAERQRVAFRANAAFARPAIYEALEPRGVGYAIRIPANKNLELEIEDVLFRSPGRPSRKPLVRYKSFRHLQVLILMLFTQHAVSFFPAFHPSSCSEPFRRVFSALPHAITWSSIALTVGSWCGPGLKAVKFAKSRWSDSVTCARTSAT